MHELRCRAPVSNRRFFRFKIYLFRGVNNSFLIAMKHTKALRYNDRSVLENHHCAIAFKLLLDPQNDIFELLSEAQYWNVRQIITKMILSSDISNHFKQISKFTPSGNDNLCGCSGV